MTYEPIFPAKFLSRPNRFIAHVELDGELRVCHVKTTGRCGELLIPGANVYIQGVDKPERKTKYDLIAVEKGDMLVNIDSQAPNKVFARWLEKSAFIKGITALKPEAAYGSSRFDFYIEAGERKIFVEVKGVTLEESGLALFPDAPTERGLKHLRELSDCIDEGYEALCVFIIQMKGPLCFSPNDKAHAAFGDALRSAQKRGLQLLALDCLVSPGSIAAEDFIPIAL